MRPQCWPKRAIFLSKPRQNVLFEAKLDPAAKSNWLRYLGWKPTQKAGVGHEDFRADGTTPARRPYHPNLLIQLDL